MKPKGSFFGTMRTATPQKLTKEEHERLAKKKRLDDFLSQHSERDRYRDLWGIGPNIREAHSRQDRSDLEGLFE